MIFLEYILFGIGALFSLFFIYYLILAFAGFWPEKRQEALKGAPEKSFIVIVPAHNEEKVIGRTLESLKKLSYPAGLFRIIVLADNCEDSTVEIARASGVEWMERKDRANPGKGQALEWAFSALLKKNRPDAFLIIDADTVVDATLLQVMDTRLKKGARVVQAYYDVLEPASSPMASLTFMGFAISRNLKYRGRSRLGLGANLLGNGMCISREIIEKFGWRAFSISEDLEYQIQLLLNGIPVEFAHEVRVYGEMPSNIRTYHSQRSRWDIGKYKLRNRYVPMLISKGLKDRRPMYWDCVLELIIPPFLLYVAASLFFYLVYLAVFYRGVGLHFYLWTSLVAGMILYTMAGLIAAKAGLRVYVNLAYAPFLLLRRMTMVVESLYVEGKSWVKTERT